MNFKIRRLKQLVDNLKRNAKVLYYENNHYHCPNKDSLYGIEGKHRCCLCKKPVDNSK